VNLHKSNSTFFSDADINRAAFLTRHFSEALVNPELNAGSGSKSANLILSGVQARFLREVRPLQRYTITSAILTWDERSLYVVTYFTKPNSVKSTVHGGSVVRQLFGAVTDPTTHRPSNVLAIVMSKYVLRAARTKIEPLVLLRSAHFLPKADEKLDELEKLRNSGLEYVKKCMF